MRIHLGHHFYGAGNLGDDFMLAGYFAAMGELLPQASFSCCVPFLLNPLRQRFPHVNWQSYDLGAREQCIAACDVWLGLGGSPFQHTLSRWFLDHLMGEAALCARERKPMFFLGVGAQSEAELAAPDVRAICRQAARIWTRDPASANYLASLRDAPPIESAADLAHIFFRANPPPPACSGRVTLVPNFDYNEWPGREAVLRTIESLGVRERVWLAQESRELPGAERALFAALPGAEQSRWRLVVPDEPNSPLPTALSRWPSGEWLITARYHAALAGAWAGSKVVVIATNEKLHAAARELNYPSIAPDADADAVAHALSVARPCPPPTAQAESAFAACAGFVRTAAKLTAR